MPLKRNDVLWTPTWVLFAACLCLKAVVISHLQPLPPGIPHPTGAYSVGLLRLCGVFPGRGLQTVFVVCPTPQRSFSALWHWVRTPTRPRCLAPVRELLDHGVSWQPRGTNFTRPSGQAEPSSSLLVSCSVFQDFCELRPKVGQRQAAPGQYLNWVSISRGKSCSLSDEVVSFSQGLRQCTLPWVWIWHSTHGILLLFRPSERWLWWGCLGSETCIWCSSGV